MLCEGPDCNRPIGRYVALCDTHYSQQWRGKPLTPIISRVRPDATLQERLDAKCVVVGDCFVWTAATNQYGYGVFKAQGRWWQSHRAAWVAVHGEISAHVEVCHSCDNPPCCNPAHLFLGTHAENMADMSIKGRGRKPRA
jgi:hypothetical protein